MMKNTLKKVLPLTLCTAMVLSACSGAAKEADSTGEGTQPDPDQTYDISYTGHWLYWDYEVGSFAEKMI